MSTARPPVSSVLVLGVGPLPEDEASRLHAPGLRTSHIAHLLEQRRHRVLIGLIEFGDFQGSGGRAEMPKREDMSDRITVCRLKYHPQQTSEALATFHKAYNFGCVVSTTDIMNSVAAKLPMHLPLWLDYNGDPFAEKQLQGKVHGNSAPLLHQWELYLNGLLAGDRFSTCSEAQRYAMLGHLGFAGRLNQYTSGEELVHCLVPCSQAVASRVVRTGYLIKSLRIPADSFMVLWSGGYNTWCDVDTLYLGLELAMRRRKELFFVSTGGELGGHDNRTFHRFENLVEESELKNRYYFAGWVDNTHMRSFYEQADAAINIDSFSYEGELGYRNRITDWLQFKVPIVSTCLCDLTRELAKRDLIYPFDIGHPESLADALLRVAGDPEAAKHRAARALEYFQTEMSDEKVYAPLLDWAEDPVFAGDRRAWSVMGGETLPPAAGLAALHQKWVESYKSGSLKKHNRRSWKQVLRRIVPGKR